MREGWKEVELGYVLKRIIGGGTPSKSIDGYWNGNIYWCSVKDMSDDRFTLSNTEDRITDIGLKNSSSNLIPANTVITATRMGLGRAFVNSVDMAINQDLKALIPNANIDNKFLLWTIIANRNKIESLGSGATVKGIKLDTLKAIKIQLPQIHIQQKIATILSAYDVLIENNLKRIKLLEEMAQQTYEEWFVRMRFPGYETAVINEETGLPEGWEKVKLWQIADLNKSTLKKGFTGKIKYIDIASVSPNQIGTLNEYEFTEAPGRARRIVNNGDIIWSCVRPNRRSYALIINPESNLIASTGFCVITAKKIPFVYLYHHLTTNEFVGYLTNLAGGAAYPAVTQNHFEEADVIIPTDELLENYKSSFESSKYITQNLQSQNQRLKEARDILLPRLMSGMISV